MPGTSAGIMAFSRDVRATHAKCQNKHACAGPGCRVPTGKTEARRRKRRIRDLYK